MRLKANEVVIGEFYAYYPMVQSPKFQSAVIDASRNTLLDLIEEMEEAIAYMEQELDHRDGED